VIFVYRPTAVLFVLIILERPLTTTEASEIVGIIVLGKSEGLSQLLTAWHTSPCRFSIYRAESQPIAAAAKLHFACLSSLLEEMRAQV